ncbi:MAG TPA: hypothetical protein VM536_16565 [Chloroflexia bacterium]|nr:hypothetical protein [Chloroflexia bacterium]
MSTPREPASDNGSSSRAWRNLMQPMPLDRKMRQFYRNLRIRIQTRQNCCGNHGQAGC